jgi:sRNA-binding carbon storage regulator CsrA
VGERVILNPGQPDEVVIQLMETEKGKARLAFDAPQHVRIMREELLKRGAAHAPRPEQ